MGWSRVRLLEVPVSEVGVVVSASFMILLNGLLSRRLSEKGSISCMCSVFFSHLSQHYFVRFF